jgi:Mg-chelatase subunit ChlD
MGLVIDSSGSMRNSNKRAGVEAAAMALMKASNPGRRSLRHPLQRRNLLR